ncbi:CpaF family protein [Cellulomonas sp. P24]|uniref:CpaF family protein n=1 Tax=Cellulomonas sp. P24 TaxID=2885206 RepID=UPI00216ABE1F|nr:CpaF/VirB11 family protein [Cellulomonas sp. P24]MCR6490929.1 CpaF/VirB11 family protein [Cellulomonas sp. P24]
MSSDPITEPVPPTDPIALPIFAAPPARAGRVRGDFSLRPAVTGPAALEEARRRRAAVRREPTTTATTGDAAATPIDWELVRAFRTVVAGRLTAALGGDWRRESADDDSATPRRPFDMDSDEQERHGWAVIHDVLKEHIADVVQAGTGDAWTASERTQMAQAIFDAVFRMGRLQPLIDDDRAENIFILGHDRVLLQLLDGSRIQVDPVADSDDELIDFLRFLANRSESNPRPFSESTPRLHLKLDGGARLAATAWVTSSPTVVVRRHRHKVDTLAAWVDRGCMSPACADFLAAAVRGKWSIVVAGPMSAGKTTLMRALCAEIPREEVLGTFETEYELFLRETGRHDIVVDWEARPGMGEIGADGRAAGAFDLDEALNDSFRFALDRQIVGEIRGREVWTMIKAMESGTGSLSTTHAASAEAAIRKLVTCAMESGGHVTRDLALEKLAGCLEVIVQLNRRVVAMPDGSQQLRRWVSEVVVVEPGEREMGYALTHLFGPSGAGPARATGLMSERCRDLTVDGFDLDLFRAEADGRGWRA